MNKRPRLPAPRFTPDSRAILSEEDWKAISDSLQLSARQAEIARCIVEGKALITIAQQVGISRHTVHSHLERLYRKLDVHSREQLVVRIFAAYVNLGR